MSLIKLIGTYKKDLVVPQGEHPRETNERYQEFSQALIKLHSFAYTDNRMQETIKYMMGLGFNRTTRYYAATYAMRRAAVQNVPNISAREKIWELLGLASLGNEQKLRWAIKSYVGMTKKTKLGEDLIKVRRGYEKINKIIRAAKERYLDEECSEGSILFETAENHAQNITLEKLQLNDILEILRSL